MTTVPFSQLFGIGTPVKKRGVWSGAARKVRSIVGARKDVMRIRPAMSGAGGISLVAHNDADMYVVAYSTQIATTPDLLTATQRTLSATPAQPVSLLYYKGNFFYSFAVAGPALTTNKSSDKGVTWASYGSGGMLSVAGDLLYIVPQPTSAGTPQSSNFWTTNDPATAVTARAFSRAGYWGKVVGNATRQYCFGSVGNTPNNGAPWTLGEVSTNGTSFSQDAGFEALAAKLPSGVGLRSAVTLADGRVMVMGCAAASGLYSLVADAAGAWSIGAQIPAELGNGFRLHSFGLVGTYAIGPASYTDADGITHVLFIVRDTDANYLACVGSTYDGKDWRFLDPHYNFGASAPTDWVGVFGKIGGAPPLVSITGTVLGEGNPDAVELYYEV